MSGYDWSANTKSWFDCRCQQLSLRQLKIQECDQNICALSMSLPQNLRANYGTGQILLGGFYFEIRQIVSEFDPPPLICADFLTKSGSKIGGLRLCPVPCTLCLVSCVLCPVSSVLCLVFASSFLCPVSGKRVLIVISHVCVLVWWLRGERGVAAIKCKCLWSRSASNCQRRTVLQQ